MKVKTIEFAPYAYESITVSDSAVGLTSSVYTQANYSIKAFITLETAQIRWRIDGDAPTSSEGHLLEVGQTLTLESSDTVKSLKAIRTGSTSGVIKVTYLRG